MSGLFLTNPDALWAFAAVAAVILLYLLRRRRRPLLLTGLFLWEAPGGEGFGGKRRERPFSRRSLPLDLLAAALFALALTGPARRLGNGLPTLVILDRSFAMRARDAYAQARELALEILAAANEKGVETGLLLAGERPEVGRGLGRCSHAEWAATLAGYLPDARRSNPREAAAFARRLYGPALDMHIITNLDGETAGATADWATTHLLPGRGGNLAFVRAWRAADADGRERLYLAIANHGGPAEAILTIAAARTPERGLYREVLKLDGGATVSVEITAAAGSEDALMAKLAAAGEQDVIADDSLAYITPVRRRAAIYRIEGVNPRAEHYLRLGLEAAGCRPELDSAAGAAPDILVAHGSEAGGRALTLILVPPGEPGVYAPPYVVDSASPLCRDFDPGGGHWVAAGRETPPPEAEILVAAGDTPLYWRSRPDRLHLNLAPELCPIVMDPAWPVLLANLAEAARNNLPGLGKTQYNPGETLHYRPEAGRYGEALAFRSEQGEILAAPGSKPPVPANPGLYRLLSGENDLGEIAVLPFFGPAADSAGLAAARRTIPAERWAREEGGGVVDLAWLALGLGLFLLGWNWRRDLPADARNAPSGIRR
ncbi:MAG: BatA domain-containing protein [Planctomycetota bacterium]|jgi:hypothetical protein|nr:BatA domain-containing protein [Planctomycetota bacterium]